ncbi:MAG: GntR family transcriptional regulator, partial [Rhodobiaceae bacterium]|nr:GntR family transcriptional regulator [Rhodobiaceae bacterium]
MTASSVDRIHAAVKQMAADFRFMPDERINEGHLAKSLDASRTPLRE